MNSNQLSNSLSTILIVDDIPDNLRLLSTLLTQQGYEVSKARNGQMALQAAKSALPDLILLDINMPDIDGYEVCKLLKADAKTKQIPVIFLSALDDSWDKTKAFHVGGAGYVTKPFKGEEVLVRVENQLALARKRSLQPPQNAPLILPDVEHDDANRGNILIVDDAPNNLRLLSTILTQQGYEVGKALNGKIALKSVQVSPPDLILLDINMPEMDGYEVCEQLKLDEKTRKIPVIFISALDDVFDKVKAFSVGGVDYITKPFQNEEVFARVKTHLNIQALQNALQKEQEKSERLLLNILPQAIVEELKQHQSSQPTQFEEATFLFADIAKFTPNSSLMPPADVVKLLNQVFSTFDQLVEKHGIEKIRTIGDSYFVGAGLPSKREDHAEVIAQMALDMQKAIANFHWLNGELLKLRIGINTGGPVVAAVIGTQKFAYDVWGDAVNIASRMESHSKPGMIQVSSATYEQLKDKYLFEERGMIKVKGKGEMLTYWLLDRKGST